MKLNHVNVNGITRIDGDWFDIDLTVKFIQYFLEMLIVQWLSALLFWL